MKYAVFHSGPILSFINDICTSNLYHGYRKGLR